jgi:hypothetical protein
MPFSAKQIFAIMGIVVATNLVVGVAKSFMNSDKAA